MSKESRENRLCSNCGSDKEFVSASMRVRVKNEEVAVNITVPPRGNLPLKVYICRECGYARLYADI